MTRKQCRTFLSHFTCTMSGTLQTIEWDNMGHLPFMFGGGWSCPYSWKSVVVALWFRGWLHLVALTLPAVGRTRQNDRLITSFCNLWSPLHTDDRFWDETVPDCTLEVGRLGPPTPWWSAHRTVRGNKGVTFYLAPACMLAEAHANADGVCYCLQNMVMGPVTPPLSHDQVG